MLHRYPKSKAGDAQLATPGSLPLCGDGSIKTGMPIIPHWFERLKGKLLICMGLQMTLVALLNTWLHCGEREAK